MAITQTTIRLKDIENTMRSKKQTTEFKIRTGDKGFKELAVTGVAFANAQSGTLYIGLKMNQKNDKDICKQLE